ncbi:MAG: DUF488 domain-containing protein [Chloroflexota bacterium]
MLNAKRVYDSTDDADGQRILVDRLWPRGIRSEDARVDSWMKELAPSNSLRKWFGHDPEKWAEFKRRYVTELRAADKTRALQDIAQAAARGNVTLVYSAKDREYNNAIVLKEVISQMMVAQQ